MFKTLLIASLVVVAGCTTPKYNYSPPSIAVSEPPKDSVSTSRIGDIMLRQGRYREHDAFILQSPREISWAYTLHPGIYLKDGEDGDMEFYSPSRSEDGGRVERATLADAWRSIMLKRSTSELCIVTIVNLTACNVARDLQRTKKALLTQDSFQQTLIYNGKVGNKINIGYREFSNNTARPAFNNNVEYDLNESMRIGYKGAELDILEATNQFIRFRLIRNFNEGN